MTLTKPESQTPNEKIAGKAVKHKRFSGFLARILVAFTGVSLALVMGILYQILSRSIADDFYHKLQAETAEINRRLSDKLNRVENKLQAISSDNTIKVSLVLGLENQIKEKINQLYPYSEGTYFFIQVDNSTYIPELPEKINDLKPHLHQLHQEAQQNTKFIQLEKGGFFSVLSMPLKRRDEYLGTAYALYNIADDAYFWDYTNTLSSGKLLILNDGQLVDLRTGEKTPFNGKTQNVSALSHNGLIELKEFPNLFYSASIEPLSQKKMFLKITLVFLCGTVFILSLLVSQIISRRISGPLKVMADQALEIARSSSNTALNDTELRYVEFRKLAQAFNEAQGKLALFQRFIETSSQGMGWTDLKGHIMYINPVLCHMLGETNPQDYYGKPVFKYYSEETQQWLQEEIFPIVIREGIWTGELIIHSKEGKLVPTLNSIFLLRDAKENYPGFANVVTDLTERKRAEDELKRHRDRLEEIVIERTRDLSKANEELQQEINDRKLAEKERHRLEAKLQRAHKMEAVGTLAGGVAHDLNNILSGLVTYPDLLLLNIPEDSPLTKPILTIKESGQRAATIVQDLLTLARRGVATKEVVNLNNIISDFLKTPECDKLREYHPDVRCEINLDPALLNILGSPVHLSKTVMNLLSNAAEAMPDGGKIQIATANRYVDSAINGYDDMQEGDYVVLSIIDSGIGISQKDLERIFEPFYTKKVMGRSGTGLGMAVVWGTMKDHNGYIDVQSTENKGSRFDLYFPVTRQKPARKESSLPIERYMGKETILVVDDVKEQREIASELLNKLGYSVTSVSSGEDAIEHMKDNSADLLILDMIMAPGIDGLETYKKILKLNPCQKAIIASGFSETKQVKEAQRLGAGAYIKKPYVLETIGLVVRTELDK